MTQLNKHDVEALLVAYEEDPIDALRTALAKVLDRDDSTAWHELVTAAGLPHDRAVALLAGATPALDALAAELNEQRELPRAPR
jgi:hypothetical protein